MKFSSIRDQLKERHGAKEPLPADAFWQAFGQRARGAVRQAPATAPAHARLRWAVAAACLLVFAGGLMYETGFLSAPPRATIRSLRIAAAYDSVMIMGDEADSMIVWISGISLAEEEEEGG